MRLCAVGGVADHQERAWEQRVHGDPGPPEIARTHDDWPKWQCGQILRTTRSFPREVSTSACDDPSLDAPLSCSILAADHRGTSCSSGPSVVSPPLLTAGMLSDFADTSFPSSIGTPRLLAIVFNSAFSSRTDRPSAECKIPSS
jgi:hypothetical protein